ncbi:MAG: PaaI family thioesterase [Acidaminococcales bacterium]|jgi:acyl-CoA thioesterase|nr:PaaI family thioesterase [Acidaminococcales bacterium]
MPREMSENEIFVLEYLRRQYSERNHFYNLLGLHIEQAYKGRAIQSMMVEAGKHTNLYANLHGGAIMSIGDSCMGVACASLGKRVVTLDTHINFIANVYAPSLITCEAGVLHSGRHTIVMGAKVFDGGRRVISSLRSTYYVIGVFEEIIDKIT